MSADYLDHLAEVLQCRCLSDLRHRTITPDEVEMLLAEPISRPAPEYFEAADYVSAARLPASASAAEARRAMIEHMRSR